LYVQFCVSFSVYVGNFFDQEFPQLASSAEEKGQMLKRADENKDAQRGPVPDPKQQGICCLV